MENNVNAIEEAIFSDDSKETELTPAQLLAEALAENARLKASLHEQQKQQALSIRISEKGGISVYGLGKFPVTLYWEQWLKILAIGEQIKSFGKENMSKLTLKANK